MNPRRCRNGTGIPSRLPARWAALLLVLGVSAAAPLPATAGTPRPVAAVAAGDELPTCPPAGTTAPRRPPTAPPGPGACRAAPTRVVPARPVPATRVAPADPGSSGGHWAPAGGGPSGGSAGLAGRPGEDADGYRHLGAYSENDYAAVGATLQVRDTGVRRRSNDFVAARVMARADVAGRTRWIEAGWTEDGWLDDDAQHVYTYDSSGGDWTYYDQYPVHDGDRISVVVESGPAVNGGTTWRAYLWWDNRWNLLAAPTLPFGPRAQLEQYVEVYVDPRRGGRYPVPGVAVSGSVVVADPGGDAVPWRDPAVPTDTSPAYPGYCVSWQERFDSWSAGTC